MLSYVFLDFFTAHFVNNQLREHLIFSLKTTVKHLDSSSVTECLGIPVARTRFLHGCSWRCSVVCSRDLGAADVSDLFLVSWNPPWRMSDKRQFRLLLIFCFPKLYKRSVFDVVGCSFYSQLTLTEPNGLFVGSSSGITRINHPVKVFPLFSPPLSSSPFFLLPIFSSSYPSPCLLSPPPHLFCLFPSSSSISCLSFLFFAGKEHFSAELNDELSLEQKYMPACSDFYLLHMCPWISS